MTPELLFGLLGVLASVAGNSFFAVARRWLEQRRLRREKERLAQLAVASTTHPPEFAAPGPFRTDISGPRGSSFYIADLVIQSLRCFDKTSVTLRFPGERSNVELQNVNVLLGNNGSGKSTVLKAVAIAALGPVLDSSGFVPYYLVNQKKALAQVTARFLVGGHRRLTPVTTAVQIERIRDTERITEVPRDPLWDELFDESSSAFFVVGYGPGRRVDTESRVDPAFERGRRRRRYLRVASLFDESASLVSLTSWLPHASRSHRDEVHELLNQALPEDTRFTGRYEGPEPVFKSNGQRIPYRALSDGFRSYIAWVGDLLFNISAVTPSHLSLRDTGGIALIDEIDLFLHPSWQRLIIPTIAHMLPNVQFIATTHSPLVVGTLHPGNIAVARSLESGTSEVCRLSEDVHGLTAEQILHSSYFLMESTRAPDATRRLSQLARDAVTGGDLATYEYLKALSRGPEDNPEGDDTRTGD